MRLNALFTIRDTLFIVYYSFHLSILVKTRIDIKV